MALSTVEARVLACLVEKEATVPDSYPLTLNSLRLACNQATNRHPVVAYDETTVDAALVALKSMGLVRFVHPSHGGRTIRYRHVAHERWQLSRGELAVLAALVLRGPQTVGEVRARADRLVPGTDDVDEILAGLAARDPEPFALRLARRPGERDARWAHLLAGEVADVDPEGDTDRVGPAGRPDPAINVAALVEEVTALRERVERLERELGIPAPESS